MSEPTSATGNGLGENRARRGTLTSALAALGEGAGIAFEAIRSNKIRSALTILGVGVGVSVVVTFAALITGVRSSLLDAFAAAGPNNFNVMRFDFTAVRIDFGDGRPPWWNRPEITPAEADRIARLPAVSTALYSYNLSTSVTFENQTIENIITQGQSAGWPAFTLGDFVAGRDFTLAEVRESSSVVVVSAALAEDLFGLRDPVGRTIRLSSPFRNVRDDFRVVGVFEPEANVFSGAFRHWIVLPYSSGFKRLGASDEQAQILVVPRDDVSLSEAQDQVIGAMRSMRGLGPRDENDFSLLASDQILDSFNQVTGVIFLVMLALSSAGILVGGVGVIGIMLISVTERTREIGIRKAVGATRREILWQFLVEAGVLTMLGGAAGLLIGGGLAFTVSYLTPVPAKIPLWSVAAALGTAAFTGMVFGLLPAYRAARLEPVEALRAE
jgi:putative ABC transport system permease protein